MESIVFPFGQVIFEIRPNSRASKGFLNSTAEFKNAIPKIVILQGTCSLEILFFQVLFWMLQMLLILGVQLFQLGKLLSCCIIQPAYLDFALFLPLLMMTSCLIVPPKKKEEKLVLIFGTSKQNSLLDVLNYMIGKITTVNIYFLTDNHYLDIGHQQTNFRPHIYKQLQPKYRES